MLKKFRVCFLQWFDDPDFDYSSEVREFDTFDEAFDFYEGTKANIDQSNLIKFKLCLDYKYESGFVVSVFEYFCKVELLNVLLKSS